MSNELYHYGKLGMKWGVRRSFYTPSSSDYKKDRKSGTNKVDARRKAETANLGKSKKNIDSLSTTVKEAKNINDSVSKMRANKMDLSKMTDQELKATVSRINLENQYRNLTAGEVSRGQSYASKVLETSGTVLAIGSSALGIALAIKELRK